MIHDYNDPAIINATAIIAQSVIDSNLYSTPIPLMIVDIKRALLADPAVEFASIEWHREGEPE